MKSERQHLSHIYWLLWSQFSWKKSLLVIWKVLELFVNTSSGDYKCSLLSRDNLLQHLQIQLSQKQQSIFPTFHCILEIYIQFWKFWKQRWPSKLMYVWTYGLRKPMLDDCLKSPVSDDPSTSNMVNGPKPCWNLKDSASTIFIYHCEGSSAGEILS